MPHLPRSLRIVLPVLLILVLGSAWLPSAAQVTPGYQGLQGGWAVDDSGNVDFLHSLAQQYPIMQGARAGWVRVNFRLGGCFSNWTSVGCNGRTALQVYDDVVNRARQRNLHVLGLLSSETWFGTQAEWKANNAETTAGNGDNAFASAFAQNAGTLAAYFRGRVEAWEVWNEPNAWTFIDSQGNPSGGSFMFPSNFAWLQRRSYTAIKQGDPAGLVVSGGIFGHDIGGLTLSVQTGDRVERVVKRGELVGTARQLYAQGPGASCPATQPSGADYLCATYDRGIRFAGWTAGAFPLDHVGQHLYVDQGGRTTSGKLASYLSELRAAYTAFEGNGTPKRTQVSEIGWDTHAVSASDQAFNLHTTFATLRGVGFVARGYWFFVQDVPKADLYYGIVDDAGSPKPSYQAFQEESAIPIAEPGPTPTAIPIVTPTRTPGPAPALGGRNFAVTDNPPPTFTWSPGSGQNGYLVLRWSSQSGFTFLPHAGPLPLVATSYVDDDPLPDEAYCYLLVILGNAPPGSLNVLGFSDFLCLYPHLATPLVPDDFAVRLNQTTTAALSWKPVASADAYQITASTFDGRAPRIQYLSSSFTSWTDDTGGATTCYFVRPLSVGAFVGRTNTLCAVPGITTLSPA